MLMINNLVHTLRSDKMLITITLHKSAPVPRNSASCSTVRWCYHILSASIIKQHSVFRSKLLITRGEGRTLVSNQ
jgi:hypothetical protein